MKTLLAVACVIWFMVRLWSRRPSHIRYTIIDLIRACWLPFAVYWLITSLMDRFL